MSWEVVYTEDARLDLGDIYDYIADEFMVPETAEEQTDRIMDAIDLLNELPLRYKEYDKEPWKSIGLRVMPIDKYLVFYLPIEKMKEVAIIRIMYQGRDAKTILEKTTVKNYID